MLAQALSSLPQIRISAVTVALQHSWFDGPVQHHPLDVSSQILAPVCSWVESSKASWLRACRDKFNFHGGSSNFPYVSMSHFSLPPISSTSILETTARCFSSCASFIFFSSLQGEWSSPYCPFIFTWTFQQPLGYSYAKPELQNLVYRNFSHEPPKRLTFWLLRGLPAGLQEWGLPAVTCQVLPCAKVPEEDWKWIFNTFWLSENWLSHRHSLGRHREKSHSGTVLSISVSFCW